MGTNCASLVADLFLFCYERASCCPFQRITNLVSLKLSILLLGIWMTYWTLTIIYLIAWSSVFTLQLNKANVSDTKVSFLDLHLSISDGFVKTKIYNKRDDFDFDIVNFPFLDGDVPRSTSYGVYISQPIRFARVSSHVDDFNTRNNVLTAKLFRRFQSFIGGTLT